MVLPPGVIAIPDELPPKVGTILLNTTAVVEVISVSEWRASAKNEANEYRVVRVKNADDDATGAISLDGSFTKDEAVSLVMWRQGVQFDNSYMGTKVPAALYYDERITEGARIKGEVTVIDTQRYLLPIGDTMVPMMWLKVFITQPLTSVIGRRQAAQQCSQQPVLVVPMDPAIQRMMRTELGMARQMTEAEAKALNNAKDPVGG